LVLSFINFIFIKGDLINQGYKNSFGFRISALGTLLFLSCGKFAIVPLMLSGLFIVAVGFATTNHGQIR
jgi:hypothetical protein